MCEESRVLTELDEEGVLLVTMNRPEKKNAFDEDQWDAFCQALRDAEADPRVAVVVLARRQHDQVLLLLRVRLS